MSYSRVFRLAGFHQVYSFDINHVKEGSENYFVNSRKRNFLSVFSYYATKLKKKAMKDALILASTETHV